MRRKTGVDARRGDTIREPLLPAPCWVPLLPASLSLRESDLVHPCSSAPRDDRGDPELPFSRGSLWARGGMRAALGSPHAGEWTPALESKEGEMEATSSVTTSP